MLGGILRLFGIYRKAVWRSENTTFPDTEVSVVETFREFFEKNKNACFFVRLSPYELGEGLDRKQAIGVAVLDRIISTGGNSANFYFILRLRCGRKIRKKLDAVYATDGLYRFSVIATWRADKGKSGFYDFTVQYFYLDMAVQGEQSRKAYRC